MKKLRTLFSAALFLTLIADNGHAKKPGLRERIATAETLCFVPLVEGSYDAVLTADFTQMGALPHPNDKFSLRETLLSKQEIAQLNDAMQKSVAAFIGHTLPTASDTFLEEKKRFGETIHAWNTKKLDCKIYVSLELEHTATAREVEYRLGRFDIDKAAAYLPVLPPNIRLTLYEKKDLTKKGKKRVTASVLLVGKHSAESFANKALSSVISERVDAELNGYTPENPLETDHFPWSKEHYDTDREALKKGFALHAAKLRTRVQKRLKTLLPAFEKNLKKKL